MHVTKHWVEQIRASGLPWALFFSIRNQIMNKDLAERVDPNHVSPSQGPVAKAKQDILTLKDIQVSESGQVSLIHVDSPEIRRAPFSYVFAYYLPPVSMFTAKVFEQGVTRKRLDDAITAIEDIQPFGVHLMCLELNKYGYLKHEITAAFERETDAILFAAALTNAEHR